MNKKKNNNSPIKFRTPYKSGKYHIFPTPNILNIYNEEFYESTVRYINSLDSIIKNKYKNVIISFVDCEYIKAAAMMILYAKIETILKKSDVNISIKMSLNNEINKFIKQAGLIFLCANRCSENDIRKTKDGYNFGKYSYTIGRTHTLEYCNGCSTKNIRCWNYVWTFCFLFIFLAIMEFIFRFYKREKI